MIPRSCPDHQPDFLVKPDALEPEAKRLMPKDKTSMKQGKSLRSRIGGIGDSIRNVTVSALRSAADRIEGLSAQYLLADMAVELRVDLEADTVWATQQQIADLFGKDVNTISEHLASAYNSKEIDRTATTRKFRVVRLEGDREVAREIEHYNLDAILAVGYRTNSPGATEFRKWATRILREYLTKGFALNEARLRADPDALQALAEQVRALRVEEKNLYARVRECFKITASDYDPSSDAARKFYTALQEKFTYAASEHTAAELILARADGTKERMGMESHLGPKITLADAKVGKNYLREDELRYLQLVADAFLIFVESKAMRGKKLTMSELLAKMDKILEFNEMPVFRGYNDEFKRSKADAHAKAQLDLFNSRIAQKKLTDASNPSSRSRTY